MEKLSSGLRIKRAGDDAAGLAISEKIRAQIRGLGKEQEICKIVFLCFKRLKEGWKKFMPYYSVVESYLCKRKMILYR